MHTQATFDALMKAEIHVIDQIRYIVDEIFMYGRVRRFQTQYVLVFRFQRFQFSVEIFILTL